MKNLAKFATAYFLFFRGYKAAIIATLPPSAKGFGGPAAHQIEKDGNAFLVTAEADLWECVGRMGDTECQPWELIGREFWLARNGWGVRFLDPQLTKDFPPQRADINDDGEVVLRGLEALPDCSGDDL